MEWEHGRVEIVWRDVVVEHRTKHRTNIILKGVEGRIEPSTMTALIGESGSGKTTLLNAIVGKSREGLRTSGEVLLNGHTADTVRWERVIGFSCKHLNAYETQTVAETLRFAMRMEVGMSETEEFIENEIYELSQILGLSRVMHTMVGLISSGEKTRLSLGIILAKKPLILMIDEFTSDLDSFNIMHVLRILDSLKRRGKGIMVSMQRPSQKMLSFFDRIILLCQGEVVFDGGLGECAEFFRKCGYDSSGHTNPSDFFIEVLSVDNTTEESERLSLERIERIKRTWRAEATSVNPTIVESITPSVPLDWILTKFILLVRRNLSDFIRNREIVEVLCIQKLTVMILLILVYLRIGSSEEGLRDRFGILSFMVIYCFEKTAATAIVTFDSRKRIFRREICAGMYGAISVYFASLLSSFCTTGLSNIAYTAVVYWAVGLNSGFWRFVFFIFVLAIIELFTIAFSIFVSVHTRSLIQAQMLSATILTAFIILGGNFVNPNNIPAFIRWGTWLSPIYYSFEAMLQNQFGDLMVEFSGDQALDGREILDVYGLNRLGYGKCICILLLITVLCILFGAMSTRRIFKPSIVQ